VRCEQTERDAFFYTVVACFFVCFGLQMGNYGMSAIKLDDMEEKNEKKRKKYKRN
jgi:hypothetical protein